MNIINEVLGIKKAIEKISPTFFKRYPGFLEIISFAFLAIIFKILLIFFLSMIETTWYAFGLILIYFVIYVINIRLHELAIMVNGISVEKNKFPNYAFDYLRKIRILPKNLFGVDNSNQKLALLQFFEDNKLFSKIIAHKNVEKIYFAGLCRVPFLFAYGTLLHNTHAEIQYLEKSHDNNKWELLLANNSSIPKLIIDDNKCQLNSNNDIAFLISFTAEICIDYLPKEFQNSFYHLKATNTQRNLIKNQECLEQITNQVIAGIDYLSLNMKAQVIHIFASVQTVVAIKIGSRLQNGMHVPVKVYNFNPQTQTHDWGLSINLMPDNLVNQFVLEKSVSN